MNSWSSLATVWTLLFFTLAVPSVKAQETQGPDEWARYLGVFVEGPSAISQEMRAQILQQPAALAFYADLLRQRRFIQSPWRVESALFWLAESGDPGFVPILLEYATGADTTRNQDQSHMALYGLARHSSVPAVKRVLTDLLESSDERSRDRTLNMLSIVNDSSARMLMRSVDSVRLGDFAKKRIRQALSQPVLPQGAGRICPSGTRVLRSEDGDYRCLEK